MCTPGIPKVKRFLGVLTPKTLGIFSPPDTIECPWLPGTMIGIYSAYILGYQVLARRLLCMSLATRYQAFTLGIYPWLPGTRHLLCMSLATKCQAFILHVLGNQVLGIQLLCMSSQLATRYQALTLHVLGYQVLGIYFACPWLPVGLS